MITRKLTASARRHVKYAVQVSIWEETRTDVVAADSPSAHHASGIDQVRLPPTTLPRGSGESAAREKADV